MRGPEYCTGTGIYDLLSEQTYVTMYLLLYVLFHAPHMHSYVRVRIISTALINMSLLSDKI